MENKVSYTKTFAYGYTYWVIRVGGTEYREAAGWNNRLLFNTKKAAQAYAVSKNLI